MFEYSNKDIKKFAKDDDGDDDFLDENEEDKEEEEPTVNQNHIP